MRLDNKTVMVTGGSRGIGREICLTLADAGANVAVIDLLEKEAAATAADVEKKGVRALAIAADVTNLEQVGSAVEAVVKEFDNIDGLVNNAGIADDTLLLRMDEKQWDRVIAVSLKGTFICTKSVIRKMLKQKSGRIVSMSSVVGINGNQGQCNYSAAKAGIIGFTKSAAKEVASRGITVNAIAPGFVMTSMTDALSEEARERHLKDIPLSKFAASQDIANAALFLLSDLASYITGHVLVVDGGMSL